MTSHPKAAEKNRQSRRSIKPYSAPFLLLPDNIAVPLGDYASQTQSNDTIDFIFIFYC
jgi:hypothetical protein